MINPKDQLAITLKQQRKSITKPRLAVYEALARGRPCTMQELVSLLAPDIDRASVYRAVRLFEDLGVIHRVYMGWKYAIELADDFQPHHHHLLCVECGHISQINNHLKLENAIAELSAAASFTLLRHQVELQGVCRNCQIPHKT